MSYVRGMCAYILKHYFISLFIIISLAHLCPSVARGLVLLSLRLIGEECAPKSYLTLLTSVLWWCCVLDMCVDLCVVYLRLPN